jgi:hypothetical protein
MKSPISSLKPLLLRKSLLLAGAIALTGCGERVLERTSDWKPKTVGGPVEIRPLPAANNLSTNYQEWISTSSGSKLLLYEARLQGSENQLNFSRDIARVKTSFGNPCFTSASFVYHDPTNGNYKLEWQQIGKINTDFLKISPQPKTFLLRLLQTKDVPIVRLQIVAVERIASDGIWVASEREYVP